MRNNTVKVKKPLLFRILSLLTVVMAVVAAFALIKMARELNHAFDRDPYGGIEYSLQRGGYADMLRDYYNRHYDVAPFQTPHQEEYHVAEYADAAFRHLFFETVGNQEMTERLRKKMETARKLSGSLSVAADDVDEILRQIPLYPENG